MHKNYYNITAKTNYELGFRLGCLFANQLRASIKKQSVLPTWETNVQNSLKYLTLTQETFPHLIEEIKGYAKGAEVPFEHAWTVGLEEEIPQETDKCTTIITNKGRLIGHNEDWTKDAANNICVLRKSVGNITILELYYINTLGGNAISINSNGYIQSINTLTSLDNQTGIPRNVIARWLSETKDPKKDFNQLIKLKRWFGYSHNFVDVSGSVFNIECTSQKAILSEPKLPFVHTNHYLTELTQYEASKNESKSKERFLKASQFVKPTLTALELMGILGDTSEGKKQSIFNERTIGRMVVDLAHECAWIWLKREQSLGWVKYNLRNL